MYQNTTNIICVGDFICSLYKGEYSLFTRSAVNINLTSQCTWFLLVLINLLIWALFGGSKLN